MSLLRKFFGKSRNADDKKQEKHCKGCCRISVSTDGSAGSPPIKPVIFHQNVNRSRSNDRPVVPGKSYMPVSKDNPYYNMDHRRRGKALIFNFDRWVKEQILIECNCQ